MLAAFFMPWIGLKGIGISGYQVAKLGAEIRRFGPDSDPVWLVWLIPIMAGITVLVSFQQMNNRGWGFLTGVTPILCVANVFVKITATAGEDGLRVAFEIFKHGFAVGAYVTLACAVGIVIASCQPPAPASEKRRAVASGDDQFSQLERLAKLRDSGVLSQEEFEAQKKLILG